MEVKHADGFFRRESYFYQQLTIALIGRSLSSMAHTKQPRQSLAGDSGNRES